MAAERMREVSVRHRTSWYVGTLILLLTLVGLSVPLAAEQTFSVDMYMELADEVDRADRAREATEEGSTAWRSATERSLTSRQAVLSYLTDWIRSGTMGERERPQADTARRTLLQNIIVLNAQLGRCDEARGSLLVIEQLVDFADASEVEGYDLARASVADCDSHGTSADMQTTPEEPLTPEPPVTEAIREPVEPPPERRSNVLPIVLIGTGSAIALGGLAYDLSLLSDRSTFSEIQDLCADRSTRSDCLERAPEAQEIADRLNGARPVIVTLYAVGLATAATGTVLLLTRPSSSSSPSSAGRIGLRPGPGDLGFGVGARF